MKTYSIIIWCVALIIVFVLTSCGRFPLGGSASPVQYPMQGVKRLRQGLAGNDTTTFLRSTYTVSSTEHLLLRFETLKEHMDNIDISSGVKIQVTLSDSAQITNALTELKVCPVTRQWMMLATWELAHPFAGGDRWSTPGGDYEAGGCVTGVQTGSDGIIYTVTTWYNNYPKNTGANYGHMVVTTGQDYVIIGDASKTYSPHMIFQEFSYR